MPSLEFQVTPPTFHPCHFQIKHPFDLILFAFNSSRWRDHLAQRTSENPRVNFIWPKLHTFHPCSHTDCKSENSNSYHTNSNLFQKCELNNTFLINRGSIFLHLQVDIAKETPKPFEIDTSKNHLTTSLIQALLASFLHLETLISVICSWLKHCHGLKLLGTRLPNSPLLTFEASTKKVDTS